MGIRDLVFVGIVLGGGAALVGNLVPPRQPRLATEYAVHHSGDLQASIRKLDDTLAAEWAAKGLTPAEPATDLAVARRIALAMMGTVPSLEEVRQFEALPTAQRLDWYLDRTLQDRRFADHFAERFARAAVGTEDGPFILYRRRRFVAWLGDRIAENRPYDALVRDLIAGDGLWTDHPETNFVTVTSQQDQGNKPDPVRLAGRVTRAFLGVRLDCAQCHNHPFNDWKQSDFQSLAAFFGQTNVGFTGIRDTDGEFEAEDHKTRNKRVVAPKVPFAPELLPADGNRRQRLAAWVTDRKNPYFAKATVNRVWALLVGRPLVAPVDNLEGEGPKPAVLQLLADDFAAHDFDLQRLIRVIVGSRAFRLDSASESAGTEAELAWAVFPLSRLRPDQVAGAILQSSTIATVDAESHIVVRLIRAGQQNDFVKRYGDTGEDEFDNRGGTIPQRLLMMNGSVVAEHIKEAPFNAATRIAWMARDDAKAIDAAYLAVLSRRPTPEEAKHFAKALADPALARAHRVEDLYWALINSTEFSWNH